MYRLETKIFVLLESKRPVSAVVFAERAVYVNEPVPPPDSIMKLPLAITKNVSWTVIGVKVLGATPAVAVAEENPAVPVSVLATTNLVVDVTVWINQVSL